MNCELSPARDSFLGCKPRRYRVSMSPLNDI